MSRPFPSLVPGLKAGVLAMTGEKAKHIFGPVPSRRLGLSLGVDILPAKTCTYDCVYCQLGRGAGQVADGAEGIPADEIIAELRQRVPEAGAFDTLTFSGSGEPTLHPQLERLIREAKLVTCRPVAVITNGSLLWKAPVRAALGRADIVLPSLDAGYEEAFRAVNRPHASIAFERMVEGLVSFSREYGGKLWLEVMLVAGVNDSDEDVCRLLPLLERIAPERIQLNTPVRPGTEPEARAVAQERMEEIARSIGPRAEVVAEYRGKQAGTAGIGGPRASLDGEVLNMLRRRPCTAADIQSSLGADADELDAGLARLKRQGLIREERRDGAVYYAARREDSRED